MERGWTKVKEGSWRMPASSVFLPRFTPFRNISQPTRSSENLCSAPQPIQLEILSLFVLFSTKDLDRTTSSHGLADSSLSCFLLPSSLEIRRRLNHYHSCSHRPYLFRRNRLGICRLLQRSQHPCQPSRPQQLLRNRSQHDSGRLCEDLQRWRLGICWISM